MIAPKGEQPPGALVLAATQCSLWRQWGWGPFRGTDRT